MEADTWALLVDGLNQTCLPSSFFKGTSTLTRNNKGFLFRRDAKSRTIDGRRRYFFYLSNAWNKSRHPDEIIRGRLPYLTKRLQSGRQIDSKHISIAVLGIVHIRSMLIGELYLLGNVEATACQTGRSPSLKNSWRSKTIIVAQVKGFR